MEFETPKPNQEEAPEQEKEPSSEEIAEKEYRRIADPDTGEEWSGENE